MKNKLNILVISAFVLAIAVLVVAQTQEELEAEKALLEQELTDADYSGTVDNVFYGIINKFKYVRNYTIE